MYDYFVAVLRCPRCGTVNPATVYTNMQTHIRGNGADGSELAVGTHLEPVYLTIEHLESAGYAVITLRVVVPNVLPLKCASAAVEAGVRCHGLIGSLAGG